MKALYCIECDDIVRLTKRRRKCRCKKTGGKYTDDINAVYEGPCVPIGIHNSRFAYAVHNGGSFDAWVICDDTDCCDTMKRTDG